MWSPVVFIHSQIWDESSFFKTFYVYQGGILWSISRLWRMEFWRDHQILKELYDGIITMNFYSLFVHINEIDVYHVYVFHIYEI